MLKRTSAQKARQRLGEMMDEVRLKGDTYIIERGNRPMVAVVPVEEYLSWEKSRERLYKKVRQIRARNKDAASETLENEVKEAIAAARQS